MQICTQCGKILEDDVKECPRCFTLALKPFVPAESVTEDVLDTDEDEKLVADEIDEELKTAYEEIPHLSRDESAWKDWLKKLEDKEEN